MAPSVAATNLEESIIRALNEKYKDFSVDEEDEETGKRVSHLADWDSVAAALKYPSAPPRRSQSWLCCPTIYNRRATDEEGGDSNDVGERKFFKDDLHIRQTFLPSASSSITVAPTRNNHPPSTQLQTTRADVLELTQRLQRSEHGRNILEQQLRESLQDRERTHRQLESLAATHESRITEMHCIIVELSKKLKTKEDGVIAEEPEGSGKRVCLCSLLRPRKSKPII